MNKKISAGVCALIAVLLCAATFLITAASFQTHFDSETVALREKAAFYDKLKDVYDKVESGFVKPYESIEFNDAYLKAYIDSLEDPYSAYLTREEMTAYRLDSAGELVGIGVTAVYDSETEGIYITNVIKSSPAEEYGIKPGDIILQVEDIVLSEQTYYDAVTAVRGISGEPVKLKILRGSEEIEISPVRRQIANQSVFYREISEGIALIEITGFDGHTYEQFMGALASAKQDNCEKYIFDVRNNPGGDLNSIVSILDELLPEGPIINIVDKEGGAETKSSDNDCLEAPFAVLANENTASAGELFTAALRDYELAKIIGTTTFGKGSMQVIAPLSDGSGLRLSSYFYNPPYGENYDGKGITPDIEYPLPEEIASKLYKMPKEQDPQIQKAIEYLNGL